MLFSFPLEISNAGSKHNILCMISSDSGESNSSDSDIGTSPSGISPSSPRTPSQHAQSMIEVQNSLSNKDILHSKTNRYGTNNDQNMKIDRSSTASNKFISDSHQSNPDLYNSIIRQHSYLNAVQSNDYKINQLIQSSTYFTLNNFF